MTLVAAWTALQEQRTDELEEIESGYTFSPPYPSIIVASAARTFGVAARLFLPRRRRAVALPLRWGKSGAGGGLLLCGGGGGGEERRGAGARGRAATSAVVLMEAVLLNLGKKPRVARTLRHELLILENRTKSISAAAAASCGGGLAAAADGAGSAAIPNE